jgi:peptidoglycan hydrolase-like protein with peptidoglycan-binding domain
VKAICGDDVRRLSIDPTMRFAGLQDEVKTRFNLSEDSLKLKFKDDEGELCLVSTDEELGEAVKIAASLKPPILRVHIEIVVEGKQRSGETNATPDVLGESARQLLGALDIPVDDAVSFLSAVFPKPDTTTETGTSAEAAAISLPDAPLQFGMRGEGVAKLQQVLIRLGHLHPGAVRFAQGIYGPRTTQAIAALQQAKGVNPTGIYDESMCIALTEELKAAPAQVAVHYGVECDGCHQCPIRGVRFKSTTREDFDLCEACVTKAPHNADEYTKIEQHHGRRGCGKGGPWMHGGAQGQMPGFLRGMMRGFGKGGCGPMHSARGWRRDGRFSSRFVADVSLPDGTGVTPGHGFTKTWKLRNDGENAWPETTALVFVKGDRLHQEDVQPVGKVEPGQEIDVSVEMIAPVPAGRYVSFWRLSALGEAERNRNRPPLIAGFGQRVWMQIIVQDDGKVIHHSDNEKEAEQGVDAVSHPAAKPLEHWSVSELKQELAAVGMDCSDCIEKEDLVNLLRATLATQKPEALLSKCPSGHDLRPYTTPHGGHTCDKCSSPVPQGAEVQRCGPCDYDVCCTAAPVQADKPQAEQSQADPVTEQAREIEHGIKQACEAFGVPHEAAASLAENVKPILTNLQNASSSSPTPFDPSTLMQMAAPFLQGLQQQQPNGPAVQPFDPSTLMQMAAPFLQGLQQQQQQQQQQQKPATPTAPLSCKTEPTAPMEQDAPAAPKDSELSVEETMETPPAEPAPGGSPVLVPSMPVESEAKLDIELPEATRLKLVQLRDMGFFDESSNLAALEKGDGHVEKALDILFQTM